jgi:hypothetical protein
MNTGVIQIKQIRGVNTGVILIKQIRGVNTGVILKNKSEESSDLFYQNQPCVLL